MRVDSDIEVADADCESPQQRGSVVGDPAAQVVAMQFAGGMSIARLAEEWERDAAWVEEAIRRALLETIPERDGGLKAPRAEERAARGELETMRGTQKSLGLWPEN